ncbi:MAG: hypothetical protein SGPRY_010654, partial [Prymnesium sp.]
ANNLLSQAERHEQAREYAPALRLYEAGVAALLESIKGERDESVKQAMRAQAASCLNKAEALKMMLHPSSSPSPHLPPSSAHNAYLPPKRKSHAPLPLPPRAGPTPSKPTHRGAGGEGGRSGGDGGSGGSGGGEASGFSSQLEGAVLHEKPNVRWGDVAGLESAKTTLQEAVVLPIRFPHLFTGERRPWKGILLYGPPGTGKSHLAKAVATEVDATFFSVSSSDLVSKWVGESEKLVRALFEMASSRRPSIIFIDEVDALATTRTDSEAESSRRLKNELLVRMGEASEGVLVLAATNMPWALDPAVRRRFEKRVYIPLPDMEARRALLKIHLGDTPHQLSDRALDVIARKSEGLSGADISVLVRDALMEPVRDLQKATHFRKRRNGMWEACAPKERGAQAMSLLQVPPQALAVPEVTDVHLERVLGKARPSVGKEDHAKFEAFTHEFGSD